MTKEPYTCPRCGYTTSQKAYMRRHLYQNKKTCPGTKSTLVMTDDVKEQVLNNRIYHSHEKPSTIINNQINNYNQITNFVSRMDPMDKITKYVRYNNIELLSIDDMIEQTFEDKVLRLENKSFRDFCLDQHNLLEVVDIITSCGSINKLNILHDNMSNRLKIYNNGKWDSRVFEHGVMELMQKVQSFYLDYYELYLLKKAYHGCVFDRQCVKERLLNYYKFLVCFELMPCIKDQSDGDVLGSDDVSHTLQDTYYPIFCELQERLPLGEANRLRKRIYEVIKTNNKSNMLELNKNMMDLMTVDECFQQIVLEKLKTSLEELEHYPRD